VLRGPENCAAPSSRRRRRRAGRGMGRGYPAPQPTRGPGERRELPSGVRGGAPAEKRILVHFELEKNESGDDKFDIFLSFL